jgi:hypothetical protein
MAFRSLLTLLTPYLLANIQPMPNCVTIMVMHIFRLVGKVNLVVDKRRVDGSRVRLAEVEIGDETGTVSLRARDEQIDVLEEVSKRSGAVVLRNCTLELYQGKHIRLAITKWGKLCTYPDVVASTPPPPSKMNFDRNFSLIDLSVVASEMVDSRQLDSGYRGSKQPDSSEGGGGGGGRGMSGSKQGGPTHRQHQQYQHSQSSTRRGSRGGDRRQSRGKQMGGSSGSPQSHYGGESSLQAQPSQMQYPGMSGFSAAPYDQAMDVRQYSYQHGLQQEVLSHQASAQQMLLQQQYEMQQRQLQQMYHDQQAQERHRANLRQGHQMQQPSSMIVPTAVRSGSFEAPDYQVSSYAAVAGAHTSITPNSPDQYGRGRIMMGGMPNMPTSPGGVSQQQEYPYIQSSRSESPFSPGKMNPQATSFAPSYMDPRGKL